MKKLLTCFILAAVTLTVVTSCSKDDNVSPDELIGKPKYKLVVKGDKSPGTKALNVEDRDGKNYMVSTWETSDVIYVHKGWVDDAVGTLSPSSSGSSANLVGELTGDFAYNDNLCFTYPVQITDCDYTGQDGTLETISKKYDYAYADGYVQSVEGNTIVLQDNLTFKSKQAIVKFILMDKQGNPVYPDRLTLKGIGASLVNDVIYQNTKDGQMGEIEVNIDQTNPHNEIYVALRMFTSASLFEVRGFSNLLSNGEYAFEYDYNKTSETEFKEGKYYEVKVKMNTRKNVNPSISNFDFDFDVLVDNSTERLSEVKHLFFFFNDVTTGYLMYTRSGNSWTKEFVGADDTNPDNLLKNGTVTAVCIPRLSDGENLLATPVCTDGDWRFGNGLKGMKFMAAEKVSYTATVEKVDDVDKVTLSGTINLLDPDYPDDVGEFVLTGTTPGGNANCPSFAGTKFQPYGLVSISSRGGIEQMNANVGDWTSAVNGWVFGDFEPTEDVCSYYALQTNISGTLTYYHYYDPVMADPSSPYWIPDWIQVGPGCTVDFGGTQWWSTNLKDDHTPEAHPWVAAMHTWRTQGHTDWYGNFDVNYSLSRTSFNFASSSDSRLPSESEFQTMLNATDCYPAHICGVDGALFVSKNDNSKYLYLIYVGDGDYFYAFDPRSLVNEYEYINKGRYWIQDFDDEVIYHTIDGYIKIEECFYWVKTFVFDINNIAARKIEEVPDRPTWPALDDQVDFFWLENPARPVKK